MCVIFDDVILTRQYYFLKYVYCGSIEAYKLLLQLLMIHNMGLQPKYFDYIKNGTKRIELRLYDEKRKQIRIGDIIEFSDGKNKMQVRVLGLLHYDTFENLFEDFDVSMLSDASMSKEEMLNIMEEFYPIEKQKKLGVIGIRIELI